MKINNTDELVPMGTFMITKPDNEDVVKKSEYVGYDYMIKFDTPFEEHNTYPISLYGFLTNLCTKVGIELGTRQEDLINGTYSILGNPFTNNESCRFVLGQLAQLAGGFAHIGRDNKLYVKALGRTPVDTIDKNNYNDTFTKSNVFGAINSLKIDLSAINGEETTRDAEGISPDDRVQLTISDNYFLIDSVQRELVIDAIFNSINGIIYTPIKTSYYGYPYADVGDLILMRDTENVAHNVYLFGHKFVSNGAYSGEIECIALTKTESAYPVATNKIQSIYKNTEFKVDKINGTMEGIIEEVNGQNQKLVQMQININEIDSKISDIADVTTSDSTNNGVLLMDNINESEPVKIEVYPDGQHISQLIVGETYVSTYAILRSRTLRFTNLTTNEVFNYIIPNNLYYYDHDNYDKFTLEYEGQICQVEKKCKLENGQIVLLDTPVITNYPYPDIPLTTGDYRIELVGFVGHIFARLMCTNIYTEQFATKVEVASEINQKADEINAQVNETLEGYATKSEMSSAINLAKDEIRTSVTQVSETATQAQSAANTAMNNAANATDLANAAQDAADNATSLANTAQSTADNINSNLSTNYFTKTETNSAINQKANQITTTVSENYSTKTETTQAKNEAISSANANTAQVLQSYSTTEQMNSAINQKANEITTSVNQVSSRTTTAQNTANSAVTKADNAQDTADDALSKANTAQSTANTATTKADNAQSTADSATTKANNAQSTANTATTKADNAQTTANTANTKAENAQSSANTATTKADNAQASADNAQISADNALQDVQDTNTAITGINENIDDINAQIENLVETTTTLTTKSELQQTAESFEASITQTTETLTRSINGTQTEISEIKNYIHYDIQDTTGTLTLGKTDNPYTLQLTNHELKINENDNTVAYFDEDSMQVTNGVFNTSLAIGNFEFRPETNGSLSFTRRLS